MALTKIKPNSIDETLEYSFDEINANTLSANTLVITNSITISGINVANQSAEIYANAAFDIANIANQRAVTSGVYANTSFDTANSSSSYANSAYNQANTATSNAATADQKAITSGDYANSSFNAANTADQRAVTSGVYANAAYGQANTADQRAVTSGVYANAAYGVANTTDQRAVTSGDYANSSYSQANTATTNAGIADQKAVSAGVYANSAFAAANTKLSSNGGTISGDLSITGNLVVLGNATSIAVSSIKIDDSLIQLAANNETSDSLDMGFFGHYSQDGGVNQRHTGLFRDATDGLYYLFYNYQDPSFDTLSPNNTIDVANSSFRVANLTANIITNTISIRGHDPINHTNSAFNVANSGSSYANSAFSKANSALANTSGVIFSGDLNVSGTIKALTQGGDEGGEIQLGLAATNTTLSVGVAIDINQNRLRFFETGGSNRGAYIDLSTAATGVGTNLLSGGGGGTTDAFARDTANAASSYANSAYGQANTATTNAATADQRAVTSGFYANSAYGQANTATTNAATADQKAVSAGVYANAAFGTANNTLSTNGGTVTGTVTFRTTNAIRSEVATTQDAIVIAGRAGGTSSFSANITPATLTATRTITVPDENLTIGFRNIPASGTRTSNYVLTTSDVGKYIQVGTGGSITIPDAVFSEGDAVNVFNNTTESITITCSITTAYIAGTDSDRATVTLATRGLATILFISSTVCVIAGNVT